MTPEEVDAARAKINEIKQKLINHLQEQVSRGYAGETFLAFLELAAQVSSMSGVSKKKFEMQCRNAYHAVVGKPAKRAKVLGKLKVGDKDV